MNSGKRQPISFGRLPRSGAARCEARTSRAKAAASVLLLAACGCQPATAPAEQASDDGKTATTAQQDPSNVAAGAERQNDGAAAGAPSDPVEQPAVKLQETGKQLYARHCAACHGDNGDGKGLAASWIFPKPRDFRAGRFRLVSTDNNVPTREDLHAVIERGMPGSAMPPWAHLTRAERDALVDEVLRLRVEGVREGYLAYLREDEELTEEEIADEEVQEEIQGVIEDATTPGAPTDVPEFTEATEEAAARGRLVYSKFGCISCHGETGRGDGVQEMFDQEKMPTRPRDFTLGIFKGDPSPESLYRRIAFGMPGTPMPGSSAMTPAETMDIVHYIRSLSSEESRQAAVLRREKIVVARVSKVPDSSDAAAWSSVAPVQLRLTPLWWRSIDDPTLLVQALHDGQTIAVRLTWSDATEDRHAAHSEAFEDGAALQLFQGSAEPFLGMGDKAEPVDVWYWDADRQEPIETVETIYPRAVTDVFPFHETAVTSAELDRPAGRTANQPDLSLPAQAVGNQIVPRGAKSGGSSLTAGGPGSMTFRIPRSQLVTARGQWADGRWTVVMNRTLGVDATEDGLSLEPGAKASVAFAIWDGASHDRNGQKAITIWQDLELEK